VMAVLVSGNSDGGGGGICGEVTVMTVPYWRATMAEEVGEAVMIDQWRVGWVVIVDYSKEVVAP